MLDMTLAYLYNGAKSRLSSFYQVLTSLAKTCRVAGILYLFLKNLKGLIFGHFSRFLSGELSSTVTGYFTEL